VFLANNVNDPKQSVKKLRKNMEKVQVFVYLEVVQEHITTLIGGETG
jgi:hypothetical protein